MRFYDAHNHLHDDRLKSWRDQIARQATESGVVRMVVNGSCEEDWPAVLTLAQQNPQVIPAFGYHPWYVHERTPDWQTRLVDFIDQIPSAVGEIGLDRWILDRRKSEPQTLAIFKEQQEVFVWQLSIAAKRNLPVSIHCLQAWGALHDILRSEPVPECGFLLHSYGGPVELVKPLSNLGAYFSLPGYYAHARKHRQRETFKQIPPDRLLIETDAPDQCLPDELNQHPLIDPETGKPLNHPANLRAVYDFAARLLDRSVEELAGQVEQNLRRLFGPLVEP